MPCEIEVHTTLTFRENVAPFLSIATMWCSGPHSRGGQGVNLRVQVAPFLPSTRDTGLRWNGTSAEPGFAGVMATRPSALQDGERRARRAPHAWSGLPASACRSPPGLGLCFREPKDMLGSPGILAHQCSPSASDDVWGSFYLVETWLKLPLQLSGSPSRAAGHVTPLSLPTPALAHHGQPSRSGPGGAARDPSGMRSAIGCLR